MAVAIPSLAQSGLPVAARLLLEQFINAAANAINGLLADEVVQSLQSSSNATMRPVVNSFETICYVSYLSGASAISIASPQSASSIGNGFRVRLSVINNSGGAVSTSWGAGYKLAGGAWADPANGKRRQIEFQYDSGAWYESWRSSGDA